MRGGSKITYYSIWSNHNEVCVVKYTLGDSWNSVVDACLFYFNMSVWEFWRKKTALFSFDDLSGRLLR